MHKTIGILGGMGTLATLYTFELLLSLVGTDDENNYPRILIDNDPYIPQRVPAILENYRSDELREALRTGLQGLADHGAEVLFVPCNTAHYFIRDIKDQFAPNFIDMLEVTANSLEQSGVEDVAVLATEATMRSGLYELYLEHTEIRYPESTQLDSCLHFIKQVKKGAPLEPLTRDFVSYIEDLEQDTILLACTELSKLGGAIQKFGIPCSKALVDPLTLVIEEVLVASMQTGDA